MITETDVRVQTKSKYVNEFKECVNNVFNIIKTNIKDYVEYDWGMDRVQKR